MCVLWNTHILMACVSSLKFSFSLICFLTGLLQMWTWSTCRWWSSCSTACRWCRRSLSWCRWHRSSSLWRKWTPGESLLALKEDQETLGGGKGRCLFLRSSSHGFGPAAFLPHHTLWSRGLLYLCCRSSCPNEFKLDAIVSQYVQWHNHENDA